MLQFNLLPRKVKWLGLAIIFIPIIVLVILKLLNYDVKGRLPSGKMYIESAIILGMALIILSKNKIEDERISLLRLQSCFYTFIFVIIGYIISHFIKLEVYKSSFGVVFQLCFVYLLSFNFPRNSWKKNAE